MMKDVLHKWTWLGVILFSGLAAAIGVMPPGTARAAGESEQAVMDMVNAVRLDPLSYAESLGYNRTELIAAMPWLEGFSGGVAACEAVEYLSQRAAYLNSQDGSVEEPVPSMDADFAYTGNIGGVISFVNFMDLESAARIIIDRQFEKELASTYTGSRYILSGLYTKIGAGVSSGVIASGEGSQNAYYITICFGSGLLRSQIQLVNMINQLRAKPAEYYRYMSVDTSFLGSGMPPLFFSDAMLATAKDALYGDVDYLSLATYYGFQGEKARGLAVLETFPDTSRELLTLWSFFSVMLTDLNRYPDRTVFFNPDSNEVGTAVYYAGSNGQAWLKLAAAGGAGAGAGEGTARIYGLVYRDADGNGAYAPGEGVAEKTVVVYEMAGLTRVAEAVTNNAGQFSLSLPANVEYSIQTGSGDEWSGRTVLLNSDQYCDLIVK